MAHNGGVHIGKNSGVGVSVSVGRIRSRRVAVEVIVAVGVGVTLCQGINRQADSITATPSTKRNLRVCIRQLYIASGSRNYHSLAGTMCEPS